MALIACADSFVRVPVGCYALPFTVFMGDLPALDIGALGINFQDVVFQTMKQVLSGNAKRIGLYLKFNADGVCLTTLFNGQGVSTRYCITTAALDKVVYIGGQDPEAYIPDPWFCNVATIGVFQPNIYAVNGIEIIAR